MSTNWSDSWTDNIESVLNKIRLNSLNMSKLHNKKYHFYKMFLLGFRMPLIFLSGINSFAAVALQEYMPQKNISLLNALISLFCGVLTSLELLLDVQKKIQLESCSEKDYYKLSIEIFKVISLEREKRMIDAKTFLDEKCGEYVKLIQSSNSIKVSDQLYIDYLAPMPKNLVKNNKLIDLNISKYFNFEFTPSSNDNNNLNNNLNNNSNNNLNNIRIIKIKNDNDISDDDIELNKKIEKEYFDIKL